MRKISSAKISETVKKLYSKANFVLHDDVKNALALAHKKETGPSAKKALSILIENAQIAEKECLPVCQDTGLAIVFAKIGQDVQIVGGGFEDAVNKGIKAAVKESYLRASVVSHPLLRKNSGDNTPAIIHVSIVKGSKISLTIMAKGAGSENMSALKMLKPSDGIEGVKAFVLETVKNAGPNPCPPIIVGVGIGGNFETCTLLAKKALLQPIGDKHKDKTLAKLQSDILKNVNALSIGASGLKGKTTCFGINIEMLPCHIASLPVAVNIECHAHRWATAAI